MLEISWSELLILAVVTLLFVGPKELPVFLRTIGRYAGMARRQANEFKSHFDAAMREAEFAQMKEEMDKMQASVNAEVLGAEKVLKDAGQAATIAPSSVSQASSFTAAAQAAVFPQSAGAALATAATAPASTGEAAAPAAAEALASPAAAPLGQVYVKPAPVPEPVTAAEPPAEFSSEPPRPQVVTSETADATSKTGT